MTVGPRKEMAMSHRPHSRRPYWLPEVLAIAAAIASALFLALYGPPAIGDVRTAASAGDGQALSVA
jgi:hypothetical protein